MKNILYLLVLCTFLFGRDDPFVPLIEPDSSVRPYYGEKDYFHSAEMTFPDTARLIKKIEVTFQNIDGSIETKSIPVSGKIDWQSPLIITHNPKEDTITNVPLVKEEVKTEESIGESKDSTTNNTTNTTDKKQETKQDSKKQPEYMKYYEILTKNDILIKYQGTLKKHFIMNNPYRIVLDFSSGDRNFNKSKIVIDKSPFKALKYGIHKDFVRIVLEIDGSYSYKVSQNERGILVNVK